MPGNSLLSYYTNHGQTHPSLLARPQETHQPLTSASQPIVAYSSSSGYTASSWRAGDTLRPNQRL